MDGKKESLIVFLRASGYLKNPAIVRAFESIDRVDFVPVETREKAYENSALPIGDEEVISQPLIVAFSLELLNPKPGEKILEIGTGSGWQTAILASIVSESTEETVLRSPGAIISMEKTSSIAGYAENNLQKYGFLESGIIKIIRGNGLKGYKKESPYDKIISSVSVELIPEQWKSQLKIGGKIVAPMRGSVFVIDKINKEEYKKREYYGFSFSKAKQ